MKTASEIRQITSRAGNLYIEQHLESVKKYIDSKIEENSRKGLYSLYMQYLTIINNDDISLRDSIIENLISHYQNLGFSVYVSYVHCFSIDVEISWKETLWQKIKKIWSKK